MARYTGPVCRICRRESMKLYLKGEKCMTKCTFERRSSPPGVHQQRRRKVSDFARDPGTEPEAGSQQPLRKREQVLLDRHVTRRAVRRRRT